ncbi:MAG: hypothetical protein PHV30_03080 [Candidatus Margulisbacteria bacterium]|nr:hypothetical protein [Candidatus Margulisiibacteriota bacterium]
MANEIFESNTLSFDAEIKLMKLLGATDDVISELMDMKAHREG